MLSFVEKEVHTVKALFADKEEGLAAEGRRREEEALAQVEQARMQAELAEAEAVRAASRADALERGARDAAEEAGRLREQLARLEGALDEATADAARARAEREKVEGEMRLVLKAMDAQKEAAHRNLSQLSRIYDDWNQAANQINS